MIFKQGFAATLALLRHRRRFVMQTARTDCGVASALTVLNMIGRKADPVLASEALNPDCAGSSLEALRRYFEEQQGIEAAALAVPVVLPLVEESEKLDLRSAVDEHSRLQQEVFPDLQVGLLHGRLSSAEKQQAIEAFETQ